MFSFVPASSESFDDILKESYSKCNSYINYGSLQDLILESSSDKSSNIKKIFDVIINFFESIMKTMKSFMERISNKINHTSSKLSTKNKLDKIKKNVKKIKQSGITTYDFYDVDAYDKCVKEFILETNRLISGWETRIKDKTSSAFRADVFIEKSNAIIKKYTDKISSIKSKKKKQDIEKVIKWIDNQINEKGSTYSATMEFIDQINKLTDYVKGVRNKLEEYSKETGYIPMASYIKDIANNSVLFLKKNYDWCIAYSASTVLAIYAIFSDIANVDDSMKIVSGGVESDVYDDSDDRKYASAAYVNKRNKETDLAYAYAKVSDNSKISKRRARSSLSAVGSAATAAIGVKKLNEKRQSGVNTIYK